MRKLLPLLLAFTLYSCASYQLQYDKQAQDWESNTPPPNSKIDHTVYLIGDAGGTHSPALDLLGRKLKAASKQSTVLYLGNNLSPHGMPPKSSPNRQAAEDQLLAQLKPLKGYKGEAYFIAGNRDWATYGIEGLKRQKKFVEKFLDEEDVFMPEPGCGEPEEVKINDHFVIILIDSEWYLADWDKHYKVNAGCEVKSRAVFEEYVLEAIKGNRNKNLLIAMHHPPYTNGPHGGQFTVKQHLFPLTDLHPALYLPLPIVGSFVQFVRGTVGSQQDAMHPKYRELSNMVTNIARQNGRFVFASGHDHSLQYIEQKEQSFIVSGAGSKSSAASIRDGGLFAYGHIGWVQVDYYEDGSAWAQYWVPDEQNPDGKVVFRTQVQQPLPNVVQETPSSFPPIPDSVEVEISEQDFARGPLWNFFWGEHYRHVYNTTIKVPTLKLEEYKGGVKPVKRGGGFQTNSLRLEGKNGKQYAMRSVNKDASRTLGYPFDDTFVTAILQDNFSAAHPLGSIATAALAKAAGIYYTQPKVFYLPPQEALGIYNEDYPGQLYTVEERPDDEVWNDYEQFGAPKEIHSTSNTREKTTEEHDERIDYRWVVRNRLFDVFIGDWDRHDDQWRWSEIDSGKMDYYRPIPRDRDQAFSKYDGFILGLASGTTPDIKKLMRFEEDVKNLKWINYNGRHFDRTFLAGADWETWKEEAMRLQNALDDQVIQQAFQEHWPQPVYELNGPEITEILQQRRNNLLKIARRYYELVSEEVNIIGTLKRDLFLVERLENGRTRVRVYDTNSKSERGLKIYDRTFLASETDEVILYGLTDHDVFQIKGEAKGKTVKVRMIGGLGQDILEDESDGRGLIFYDAKGEGSLLQTGSKAKIKLKKDPIYNTYDHESPDYNFDYTSLLPFASFNPDDGVLLGFNMSLTQYGFKKSPFASNHKITGLYALATNGVALDYQGTFIDLFGPFELGLDANFQTLLYSTNFYGFGNETVNLEEELEERGVDDERDYNRVRQQRFFLNPSFMRQLNANSRVLIGPTYESIQLERTEGRFIDEVGDALNPDIFDGIDLFGGRVLLDYQSLDQQAMPTRGLRFELEGGYQQQLQDGDRRFGFLNTAFSAYQRIDANGQLVFATRVGLQHRFGEGFEFFQAASLGGPGPNANFRGFRRARFIGRTAFYQNIDLRWKIVTSDNPTLPFSMGITGGFDHGRVWLTGEDSDTWHYSYGGSIWFSPFDLFVLNAGLYVGDDNIGLRMIVGGGFFF
jgi:hypothetical protein